MYILFEKMHADSDTHFYDYDAMGYTDSEEKAMKWCDQNSEYRRYKYCPDRQI